jgi:hypothetical protein
MFTLLFANKLVAQSDQMFSFEQFKKDMFMPYFGKRTRNEYALI